MIQVDSILKGYHSNLYGEVALGQKALCGARLCGWL